MSTDLGHVRTMHFLEHRFHINAEGNCGAVDDIKEVCKFFCYGRQGALMNSFHKLGEFFTHKPDTQVTQSAVAQRWFGRGANSEYTMEVFDLILLAIHFASPILTSLCGGFSPIYPFLQVQGTERRLETLLFLVSLLSRANRLEYHLGSCNLLYHMARCPYLLQRNIHLRDIQIRLYQ